MADFPGQALVRTFGELCVTAGILGVLFFAYLVWGTAMQTSQHQHALTKQLQREWSNAHAVSPYFHLAVGQPFAFIRIPAFGAHWRRAMVQGAGLPQLALGPGHILGTAMPGQVGNFGVAAHRVTAGNPFYHLPDLRQGDEVLIDTAVTTFIYRVTSKEIVLPSDTAVLDPVPGHPGQRPHERLITLITCDPPWTGTHRIIVFGSLYRTVPRHEA